MNIILKSFAEEVPVTNLKAVNRYIVLESEDGRELKVPVGEEAIRTVAAFVLKAPPSNDEIINPPQYEEEPEQLEEGVSEFGGDEEEVEPEQAFELPPKKKSPVQAFQLPESPESEEDVKSL